MNIENVNAEQSAADKIVTRSFRIEDVDLEPTPTEVEFFLTYKPGGDFSHDTEAHDESLGKIEEAFAQYVAMNRKSSQDTSNDAVAASLEAKRRQLLEELERAHGGID